MVAVAMGNDTRTEKAVQNWVSDKLGVARKRIGVEIDGPNSPPWVNLTIGAPLTGKPTDALHEVFGRVGAFAQEGEGLIVGHPSRTSGRIGLRYFVVHVE